MTGPYILIAKYYDGKFNAYLDVLTNVQFDYHDDRVEIKNKAIDCIKRIEKFDPNQDTKSLYHLIEELP